MPVGQFKTFQECKANYLGKVNPKTGKKFTEEEAGSICGEIEKRSMSESKFVLSEIIFSDGKLEEMEFEILSAGKKVYRSSIIEIKESDLDEMVNNFNNNIVGTQLALDKNHEPENGAFAWIKSLRKDGNKLLASFKDFSSEGEKYFKEKVFKYFSVEFDNNFQAIIDGVKKTFKNVLRGVALTNRPVDKQLAPTFMSETIKFKKKNMNAVKLFAESLLKKESVSKEEKDLLNEMFSELSDEEKEEVKEDIEQIQEKPEEEEKPEDEEKPEEEESSNDEKAELSEKAQYLKLSERVKTQERENSKLKNEIRSMKLSEMVESELQLSEKNPIGLSKEKTDKAIKFFSTLSDRQIKEVISLIKSVKSVDFSEYGVTGEGVKTFQDKNEELNALAEEKVKKSNDNISFSDAVAEVLRERKDIAEYIKNN